MLRNLTEQLTLEEIKQAILEYVESRTGDEVEEVAIDTTKLGQWTCVAKLRTIAPKEINIARLNPNFGKEGDA